LFAYSPSSTVTMTDVPVANQLGSTPERRRTRSRTNASQNVPDQNLDAPTQPQIPLIDTSSMIIPTFTAEEPDVAPHNGYAYGNSLFLFCKLHFYYAWVYIYPEL